jgi:hypothetical protein
MESFLHFPRRIGRSNGNRADVLLELAGAGTQALNGIVDVAFLRAILNSATKRRLLVRGTPVPWRDAKTGRQNLAES